VEIPRFFQRRGVLGPQKGFFGEKRLPRMAQDRRSAPDPGFHTAGINESKANFTGFPLEANQFFAYRATPDMARRAEGGAVPDGTTPDLSSAYRLTGRRNSLSAD
jgi:hypothetical protein